MIRMNAVIYYTPTILSDAGFGNSGAVLATVGVGLVNMTVTIVALLLIDRLGCRPLLIGGISVVFLSLLLPGGSALSNVFLVGGLMVYIAAFAASLGIAIWLLNLEVYPSEVRSKGAVTGSITHWTLDFIIASAVLTLINVITPTGLFWFYDVSPHSGSCSSQDGCRRRRARAWRWSPKSWPSEPVESP